MEDNTGKNRGMQLLVLGLFCTGLLLCIVFGWSVLYALLFGLILFLLYGKSRGFSWQELGRLALKGVMTVKNILLVFVLIGMLTALWRASGTIAVIVCYASALIRPSVFLLMAFLLNCGLSALTGTSFGTAATIGVICAAMGTALKINPLLTGGAILSGAFFGDRCSPVSTSALLVAAVTETDIYDNIKGMLRSALVPFLLAAAAYAAIGFALPHEGELLNPKELFSRSFVLSPVSLLPAAAIIILALFRVDVKLAMAASIAVSIPVCLAVQKLQGPELMKAMLTGFYPEDPEVAAMISGGGIASMLRVGGIVCLSSSYSELFRETGLLDGVGQAVSALREKTTNFTATLVTAVVSGMIACNQTLAILLTNQICGKEYTDKTHLAVDLEDTAVVIPPLIPWSIAGAVPLATVGAPAASVLFAFYLIAIPLWRLIRSLTEKQRRMAC